MGSSRKKKVYTPTPGWALYLRTSDEESQNPEASQQRQRYIIEKAVLERSELPVIEEYKDVLTGRSPQRIRYQRMLSDAWVGKFSHVVVERADRFGRNDTEALRAIDELDAFGVSVRFANQPDLDPVNYDDRVLVALTFTLARRESILTGLRIKGATEAKRQEGGYIGRIPEGYISVEDPLTLGRKTYAKRGHHLELDPERAPILREAWNLLLEDRWTLAQICEKLHAKGYRYRTGRPFVDVSSRQIRSQNYNTLAKIFHNWTYAGWVVHEPSGVLPKTLRGIWEPMVSTEDFERGLVILAKRNQIHQQTSRRKYLLRGLVYLSAAQRRPTLPGDYLYRLTCSTSNGSRSGGGTSHYRLERHPVHFLCHEIESQLDALISRVCIDESLLPHIRASYVAHVGEALGQLRPDEHTEIASQLKKIDEEEARVLRLYAGGVLSEDQWRGMWAEWQDRRQLLHGNLHLLEQSCEDYIRDLDDALTLIAKLDILYEELTGEEKRDLLVNLLERVVVDTTGKIVRVEWLSPFAYLQEVANQLETKTGGEDSACSRVVLQCGPKGLHDVN